MEFDNHDMESIQQIADQLKCDLYSAANIFFLRSVEKSMDLMVYNLENIYKKLEYDN